MKNSKANIRIISLILAVVMCLSIFVGCVPNIDNGDNTGNNGNTNQGNNDSNDNGSNDDANGGGEGNENNPDDPHICSFGDWVIVKEPTNSVDGLRERKCDCGKVEQEVIVASNTEYYIKYRNLKSADYPEESGYNSKDGLLNLPQPEATGYTFIGWYTASIGGELIDYIPEGSKKNYILYAHWELVSYEITYKNVPNNVNPTSYNIESKLKLETPKWSGLVFTHWSDEDGNIYTPSENITSLPEKTSGDMILTANWKVLRNIVTPAQNGSMLYSVYSGEEGNLYFYYDLGTIEHVVLDEIDPNLYYKFEGMPMSLTLSKTATIGEATAKSISDTVSKSITQSQTWSKSCEYTYSQSDKWSSSLSSGLELGSGGGYEDQNGWGVGGNIGGQHGSETKRFNWGISANYSKSHTEFSNWSVKTNVDSTFGWERSAEQTAQWGASFGQSYEENETYVKDITSSLEYKQEITSEITESYNISADLPSGYYAYVHAGNVRVIGIVTYEISTGFMYLDVYSHLDNMHAMIMYYSDVNQLNNPSVEGLDFKIPEDEITNYVEKSYYVNYDSNGGTGKMTPTIHSIDGTETLAPNKFTKTGSIFAGWALETVDGVQILTDGQSVTNLGGSNHIVTLKAIWTSDPEYDKDVVYTLTTKSGSYSSEPQMRYSALIEYRNRTEDSVEIRITWTTIKEHGFNSYGQNFEFSCGGVSSGGVRICGWDGLADGYATATKDSGWVKISLNTSGETTVKLTVKYWQSKSDGSWFNEKINTTWTIEIPAAK